MTSRATKTPRVAGDDARPSPKAVAQQAEREPPGHAVDDDDEGFEREDGDDWRGAVHEPLHLSRYADNPSSESLHDELFDWSPPSLLDAPEPLPGYVQRWIRCRRGNEDDGKRISQAVRTGWQPRDVNTVPGGWSAPTDAHRRFGSCITVEGMILMQLPIAIFKKREEHYRRLRSTQMQAVQSDLLRVQEPGHPIGHQYQTRVTVGQGRRPPVQPDN